MEINSLVHTLRDMNKAFGEGKITKVEINLKESDPIEGNWYGTVIRNEDDVRLWKCENGYIVFLSRKRKLY